MTETGLTTYKRKSGVELRREMVKMPSVMGALEPIERAIILSSTDKVIAEYDTSALAIELGKALKFIAKDVGYTGTDETERNYLVVRLCEILVKYYPSLTMRDFRMAFEMCIAGELDAYLPKGRDGKADRGHYQQFNAEYVCKIINAYKSRRSEVICKAIASMPAPEFKIDPKTNTENWNLTKRDCINAFVYFKENGRLPGMSPIAEMLYYRLLSDAGLAPEIEVTIEEQKTILIRTVGLLVRKGEIRDARRLELAGPTADEIQPDAFKLARRRALIKAFERIKAENIDITDYIKFE